jgi:hypothetical protein
MESFESSRRDTLIVSSFMTLTVVVALALMVLR